MSGHRGARSASAGKAASLFGVTVALLLLASTGLTWMSTAQASAAGAGRPGVAVAPTGAGVDWAIAGHPHGVAYRANVTSPHAAPGVTTTPAPAASTNPNCPSCAPPLLFAANHRVMGGSTSTPGLATITPIFWAPSGYSFPGSYKQIIDGYLTNVAAASGSSSDVFGVATQYYQDLGAGKQPIHYIVRAGPQIDVTDGYPSQSSGCTPDTGYTACVTDAALQSELQQVLTHNVLPADDSHLYMVLFPPAVQTCFGTGQSSAQNACSSNAYCGYHSAFSDNGQPAIYADLPYAVLNGCSDPFNGPQAPNGDPFADTEISIISHEASEAITDWTGAWYDAAGYENGDECGYTYGTPLGSTGVAANGPAAGTHYNQMINGAYYYTQDEFSNADYAAGHGDVTSPTDPRMVKGGNTVVAGCVQRPSTVQAAEPTVATVVEDAASGQSWTNSETTGASAVGSTTVTGMSGVTPTGTVSYVFYANGTCSGTGRAQGTTALAAGAAPNSDPTGALPAGVYSFQATYWGDSNYVESTGSCQSFTVNVAPSTTISAVEESPSGQAWTNNETVGAVALDRATVTGAPGITATGSVSYALYAGPSCSGTATAQDSQTMTAGSVPDSAPTRSLAAGNYSFEASYSGDANYNASSAPCRAFSVSQAGTTMTTTIEEAATGQPLAGTEAAGSAVMGTATLTGVIGFPPTGTVSYAFYTGDSCTGNPVQHSAETLSGGTVPNSASTGPLATGTYSFQAQYSGDSNYLPTTGSCQTFLVATDASTVATVVNDATSGQSWTGNEVTGSTAMDSATVTGVPGLTPTGTVSYALYFGPSCGGNAIAQSTATLMATGTVPNSAPTSPLGAGTYGFVATYSGDANYTSATSSCESFTVAKAVPATATAVVAAQLAQPSGASQALGSEGTAAATVTGVTGFTPGGTVSYSFYTGSSCAGTPMTQSSVGLNSDGSVPQSPPTSPLGAGTYSVQASYSGDNNYLATAGSCETFSVAQGSASTTTVIDDAATGGPWTGTEAPGSAAIAGATVSGISGLTPTGTVSYTLYNNGSCSGTPAQTSTKSIVGNQVADSDPTSSLAAGTYSFQATYSGDANYVGSIGSCQSFTVPVPYIAIAPTRLFDTRYGTGGVAQAPLGPGQILKVKVLGTAAVPANSNATAVALNLTAVGATAPTYLTVWPDGTSRPTASNLNPYDAGAAPNFDVVAIGSDGYIDIYNAAGSVNLLADVAGYYTPTTAYTAITPNRLFDTRYGTGGVAQSPLGPGQILKVKVLGTTAVPANSNATAVALNLTAVGATAPTYLTVWPDGTSRPTASNLNPYDARAAPNFDVVAIGSDGYIDIYNAAGSVNLLADVAGYVT